MDIRSIDDVFHNTEKLMIPSCDVERAEYSSFEITGPIFSFLSLCSMIRYPFFFFRLLSLFLYFSPFTSSTFFTVLPTSSITSSSNNMNNEYLPFHNPRTLYSIKNDHVISNVSINYDQSSVSKQVH